MTRAWQALRAMRSGLAAAACCLASAAVAQDAARGARLYVQLPLDVRSCVSCHGPDPTQNRNNILRAADQPAVLLRTLNTVGAMGYLRDSLGSADIADITAYLGRVAALAAPDATVALWPSTIEFGRLPVGSASPSHSVRLRNPGLQPLQLSEPELVGEGFLLEQDCPVTLMAGQACTVVLRAVAAVPGSVAASLRFAMAGSGSPFLVGVSLTVVGDEVGVLSADVPTLAFGSVDIDPAEAVTREIVLRSHGTAPVTLGVTTLTGPERAQFRLDGGCGAGTVLAPGENCTMKVSYAPAVAGVSQAALQWRSDGGNPGTVTLEGRAIAVSNGGQPPTPEPTSKPAGSGAGGCSIAAVEGAADPVHGALVLAALAVLWRRRRTDRMTVTETTRRCHTCARPSCAHLPCITEQKDHDESAN